MLRGYSKQNVLLSKTSFSLKINPFHLFLELTLKRKTGRQANVYKGLGETIRLPADQSFKNTKNQQKVYCKNKNLVFPLVSRV